MHGSRQGSPRCQVRIWGFYKRGLWPEASVGTVHNFASFLKVFRPVPSRATDSSSLCLNFLRLVKGKVGSCNH